MSTKFDSLGGFVFLMRNRHCVKYARIRVFTGRIIPYKDRIVDSALIPEYSVRENSYSDIFDAVNEVNITSILRD